jgi:putative transposase
MAAFPDTSVQTCVVPLVRHYYNLCASTAPVWRQAWHDVIPFVAFNPEICKIIYAINVIECLNRVTQKSIKAHGSLPTE